VLVCRGGARDEFPRARESGSAVLSVRREGSEQEYVYIYIYIYILYIIYIYIYIYIYVASPRTGRDPGTGARGSPEIPEGVDIDVYIYIYICTYI